MTQDLASLIAVAQSLNLKGVIDTHVHLDDLADETQESMAELASKAFQRGIGKLVIPGLYPEQWCRISDFTKSDQRIYFAVGVHPWWVNPDTAFSVEDLTQALADFAIREDCIAIGETGLDKLKKDTFEAQRSSFIAHLELAQAFTKPAIIHCVRAHDEMQRVLKSYKNGLAGVIHGFSGSLEVARHYWAKGLHLGIGGTITYERANKTREAVARLPIESLVLETDAPAMPVCGFQGQANRPEQIALIALKLAELRNEPVDYILEKTTENAQRLFNF
ncbi:metal-dependent hydrolase [Sessilibacter sp. MAH1]